MLKVVMLFGVSLLLLGETSAFAPPPEILYPEAGTPDVHPGDTYAIRFAEQVDPGIAVDLRDAAGAAVPVTTRHSADDHALLVTPVVPLAWDASYELCMTPKATGLLRVLFAPPHRCAAFHTMPARAPDGPAAAPILVAAGRDRPDSPYYGAILTAEGLNAHASLPLDDLQDADLAGRAVVILDSATVPTGAAAPLQDWAADGGLLILMRPGPALRQAYGLPAVTQGPLDSALLQPSADHPVTAALSRAAFQIHGPIDRTDGTGPAGLAGLVGAGGAAIATDTITAAPYGQGTVASFAFDLAQSVVLTRQGNPLYVDEERDASRPLRPNDLFYPDFIDLDHAAVPAADEVQRLLVNLIVTHAPLPLPRLWYLPDQRRAALIMAGDDHATDGGAPRLFKWLDLLSATDCDVAAWTCRRATAYLTPSTRLEPDLATFYARKGFEIGAHVDTGCEKSLSRETLLHTLHTQITSFTDRYPDLPSQQTHRMHCLSWTGWTDVPQEELGMGFRLDLNYYLWPPKWIAGRQVFLTGSGFPMPFARRNGDVLGIYQAASHLVNESGVPHEAAIAQVLDGALGPDQYFGAFGTHYDFTDDFAQRLIGQAVERDVALISAQQMLTWLDGHDASTFHDLQWDGGQLDFAVELAPGAERASILLPIRHGTLHLSDLTCGGQPVQLHEQAIKGLEMAFFQPSADRCRAIYQ